MSLPLFLNPALEKIESFLTIHLQLSQESPLNLNIYMELSMDFGMRDLVMESLVLHVHRWKTVQFHPYLVLPSAALKNDFVLNVPLLHTLKLEHPPSDDENGDVIFDVFKNATSLRVLELGGEDLEVLELPWEQITDFTLKFVRLAPALQHASLAREATHITFSRCYWDIDEDDDDEPDYIVHNLTSLTMIIDDQDSDFFPFFEWLTLPCLSHLCISGDEDSRPQCYCVYSDDYFAPFLSRSSCNITSLSIIDVPMKAADMISFIFSITSLSTLVIDEKQLITQTTHKIVTIDFLEALTLVHNSTSKRLCHLQHLDLRFHATFPAKHVIELVRSRSIPDLGYNRTPALDGVNALKSVKIQALKSENAMAFDGDELIKAMEVCIASGLQSSLSSEFVTVGEDPKEEGENSEEEEWDTEEEL
ncbi:hypothetical protein VKT23_002659 [Stygiomarasmius scandens]|uniref:F-box protein n=1 Tax=Marasmiellus scandens TaxID=2682957 RepID=A0ABR1K3T0_9AGAR